MSPGIAIVLPNSDYSAVRECAQKYKPGSRIPQPADIRLPDPVTSSCRKTRLSMRERTRERTRDSESRMNSRMNSRTPTADYESAFLTILRQELTK
jgi:hypothetical protein